jgi:plastocyanin
MRHRPKRLWQFLGTIAALVAMVFVFGIGLRDAQAQNAVSVSIVNFAFEPASVEVPVGGTVTWTNNGGAPHTVTADDGAFDSGELAPGASFSQTFDAAGTFAYHCNIHPQMTGTVNVVAATAAPAQAETAAPAAAETAAPAAAAGATPPAEGDREARRAARDQEQAVGADQLPRTGVGAMALSEPSETLPLLAALAALVLGACAVAAYRRA